MSVRIKICGVTRVEDIRVCADAGADAVGINFHPTSPRYADPRQAMTLVRAVPPLVSAVGVFVEKPMRQVCALAYQLGLRGVQWHGADPEVSDPFPFSVIAAFRIKDRESLHQISIYLEKCRSNGWQPGAVLVDAFVEGQHGGTGQRAPWDLLTDFSPGVPLILAGGLTPDNVADAIRMVRPWGVDVASGVESSPGIKDHEKVRRLIEYARRA